MIQYGKQNINDDDKKAVIDVFNSGYLTQGPQIEIFEKKLASYCNVKYALALNSGTAALHLAYLAANIGEGDEVIVPPNTFVATTNMLLACGAKLVFCDIDINTHNIDESKIESLITSKTKAIVAVDFSGRPCEYEEILNIAKKHNLLLIDDAAHSLGADYKNSKVGGIADMTTLSFHPVKSITTAEGGALLTNNRDFFERAKLLRSHGVTKNQEGENQMFELGYNYRISDLLAALGSSQLDRLDEFITKRREVVTWYEASFGSFDKAHLPAPSNESSWHLYVIRTDNKETRKLLREHLLKADIGVNFHYPAVYKHPYYQKNGFDGVVCPNMDLYHDTAITLPCHTLLEKSDIDYICKSVKSFFNE